ncbi:MAG: hypothetical protein ACHQHN_02825 [Sphingobacteriales bacterium]
MRTLLNPWFLAGCLVWSTIMITRKFLHHPIPILNGYIDDVFAVPVIASIALCFQRVFIIRSNYYVLSAGKVAFIVVYLTLVFEVFLPMISKTYTGDWIDAVLYAIGGLFFYRVMDKPILSRKPKA